MKTNAWGAAGVIAAVWIGGCAHVQEPSREPSREDTAMSAGAPAALDGAALAESKECMSCHSVEVDKIGPGFRNVARRFADLNNGRELLVNVIRTGTDSATAFWHWGSIKMPSDASRAPVNEAEANALVDYIFSLK